jgi:hypothetical protein
MEEVRLMVMTDAEGWSISDSEAEVRSAVSTALEETTRRHAITDTAWPSCSSRAASRPSARC